MNHLYPNPDLSDLRYGKVALGDRNYIGVWNQQNIFFLSTDHLDIIKKALEYCPWLADQPCRPASVQESRVLGHEVKAFFQGANGRLRPNPAGTPFQLKVWKALLAIPRGQTRSYGEIARSIGKPKAFRAVGTACGRNPVPFLIPCHRVIQSSGGLGGFGLSLPLKKHLLAMEAN